VNSKACSDAGLFFWSLPGPDKRQPPRVLSKLRQLAACIVDMLRQRADARSECATEASFTLHALQ
jgi:hypothetical protein